MAISPFILTGAYEAYGESASVLYYATAISALFMTLFGVRFMVLRTRRLGVHMKRGTGSRVEVGVNTATACNAHDAWYDAVADIMADCATYEHNGVTKDLIL